jgi:hypothetical protein
MVGLTTLTRYRPASSRVDVALPDQHEVGLAEELSPHVVQKLFFGQSGEFVEGPRCGDADDRIDIRHLAKHRFDGLGRGDVHVHVARSPARHNDFMTLSEFRREPPPDRSGSTDENYAHVCPFIESTVTSFGGACLSSA